MADKVGYGELGKLLGEKPVEEQAPNGDTPLEAYHLSLANGVIVRDVQSTGGHYEVVGEAAQVGESQPAPPKKADGK